MNRLFRFGRAARVASALIASLALVAALVAGFGTASPVAAQQATVEIVNFTFNPGTIEVAAGTTVTWVNNDTVPHTATGDTFDTGTIAAGASASITFDTPGTYAYICTIHPDMMGTVVVTAAPADGDAAPTAPPTALPGTGTGAAAGTDAFLPLAAALLAVTALLGAAGLTLLRRATR